MGADEAGITRVLRLSNRALAKVRRPLVRECGRDSVRLDTVDGRIEIWLAALGDNSPLCSDLHSCQSVQDLGARLDLEAEPSTAKYVQAVARDRENFLQDDFLDRWLLMERQYAAGRRTELSFFDYLGPSHVRTFMEWIEPFHYPDWFLAHDDPLISASHARDSRCLDRLGLDPRGLNLAQIGVYNAQDYRLQRFYPMPEAQQPRVILDFGAGHGRLANLCLRPDEPVTELMIAVDGIAGAYLTQRAYYAGLGIDFVDYIDVDDGALDMGALAGSTQLVHLPTWRLDLIPDSSVDMVCAVQVLKELPRRLVWHVLEQFARVLKPGGTLYVRDHKQDHNPNQMPLDDLISAHGLVLEFEPHVHDRVDIHGLPRMWRRLNPTNFDEREK